MILITTHRLLIIYSAKILQKNEFFLMKKMGISAIICIGREIQCLPYTEFFKVIYIKKKLRFT